MLPITRRNWKEGIRASIKPKSTIEKYYYSPWLGSMLGNRFGRAMDRKSMSHVISGAKVSELNSTLMHCGRQRTSGLCVGSAVSLAVVSMALAAW